MPHPDSPSPGILDLQPPSPEQAKAIHAAGGDVLVTAGAGTGKTRTLVGRYLSLLERPSPLRSLVAITFTRKAAREMRNRIRQTVLDYLSALPPDDPERPHWEEIIAGLDGARIGTIHSFCGDLLRSHPAEANLDPRFAVLDEGQTALRRAEAVDAALTWAAERPELSPLLGDLGEPRLRDLVSSLLAEDPDRQASLDAMDDDPERLLAAWESLLAGRQLAALEALLARADWQAACRDLENTTPLQPHDKLVEQAESARMAIAGTRHGSTFDRVRSLQRLREINLTGGSQSAWQGGKEEKAAVVACLKWLRAELTAQLPLNLAINGQDEAVARTLVRLRPVAATARHWYANAKAQLRALDFNDLEVMAIALLEAHPDVRQQWQGRLSAILVDEFQDTNGRQRQLLDLLNGGGRLFLVGDAKQSIYGFRGADVTVFRQTRRELEHNGGHVFELVESYRGHKPLVEALNTLLRPVLGEQEDPARPWLEPFARLEAHRPQPRPTFLPPHVELHLAVGIKSENGLNRAASALAARLVHLIEEGVCRPGDVAILCRAASAFPAYENALEHAGIPFLTVAGKGFYDRPEVRDLLNILQALADPTDDLALTGALRSPVLGLSDAALYQLAVWRDESAHHQKAPAVTLWETLKTQGRQLPGDEGRLAERACSLIAGMHQAVGRASAADVLKHFLDATDYQAALLAAGQTRAERNVTKLLADARRSGLVKVSELLTYVGQARDVDVREGEARTVAEDSVQIMSIHQAKGLEFPVVVLGDLAYRGGRSDSYYWLDGTTLTLSMKSDDGKDKPSLYALAAGEAADKEAAEEGRLLYVAATRAQERLILNGNAAWKNGRPVWDGWWKRLAPALNLEDAAWPEVADEGGACHTLALALAQEPVACSVYEPKWQSGARLAAAQTSPAIALPTLLGPVADDPAKGEQHDDEDSPLPERVWRVVPPDANASAPQWVVGKLVHAAIAQWRFEDLDDWLQAKARGLGVTDARELRQAVSRAKTVLRRFQQHDLWAKMDAAELRRHEIPFAWQDGGRIEQGVIDVIYRYEGRWRLVDFKIDRLSTLDKLKVKTHTRYTHQVRNYLRAASVLLETAPEACLCFLDVGGAIVLKAVTLTSETS